MNTKPITPDHVMRIASWFAFAAMTVFTVWIIAACLNSHHGPSAVDAVLEEWER